MLLQNCMSTENFENAYVLCMEKYKKKKKWQFTFNTSNLLRSLVKILYRFDGLQRFFLFFNIEIQLMHERNLCECSEI